MNYPDFSVQCYVFVFTNKRSNVCGVRVNHDHEIEEILHNKIIADIDRVGKLMIFSFKKENDIFLLAHLKMTGQFFFVDNRGDVEGGGHSMAAADMDLPMKHTRVGIHFTDKSTLYFNDMRLFGYVKIANAEEVALARSKFGPEPIKEDFDCDWFTEKLKKRNTPIKAAPGTTDLLDYCPTPLTISTLLTKYF